MKTIPLTRKQAEKVLRTDLRPVPTTHRRIVLSGYSAQDEDIAPYLTAIGA